MRKFLLWVLVITWLIVAYIATGVGVVFYVVHGGWLFGGSFGWVDVITWIGTPVLVTYSVLAAERVTYYINWNVKRSVRHYITGDR